MRPIKQYVEITKRYLKLESWSKAKKEIQKPTIKNIIGTQIRFVSFKVTFPETTDSPNSTTIIAQRGSVGIITFHCSSTISNLKVKGRNNKRIKYNRFITVTKLKL